MLKYAIKKMFVSDSICISNVGSLNDMIRKMLGSFLIPHLTITSLHSAPLHPHPPPPPPSLFLPTLSNAF